MELYPSFLLLFLACSVQLTFCKSVLNLNPDLNRARRETWTLKDNKWIRVNRAHPSAVRGKRSVGDQGMDKLKLKLVEEWDKLHNNGEENEMNRAIAIGSIHPPAVRGKRSVVDLEQDYVPCGASLGGCKPRKRSVEVEDQGMDQEQDEYLEVEDNYMYEDYSTATSDQHRDENNGQEPLSCFTVDKHGLVVIDDILLTLDDLNGLIGLDGKSWREEYEECEKRGKNKHEV